MCSAAWRCAITLMTTLWLTLPSMTMGAMGQALTLSDYLSQVQEMNPSITASKRRSEALGHRIRPNGTVDDPFFAVGVDEIAFDGSGGSVTRYQLSQSIPFPGKLSARGGIAKGISTSAGADAETTKREIKVVATQTYYRAFYNQESIQVTERIRKLLEETAQSAKARYETGDVGHHDWLLAKVELSILDVDRLKLEREKKTLHAFLNELRNQHAETEIKSLALDLASGSEDPDIEPVIADSPELKSIEGMVASANEQKRLARLSYFPDFVIQGMAMSAKGPLENRMEPSNWGFMVGINLPIFFSRRQSELSTAALLDQEAAVAERKTLENRLKTEVIDAKQQLKTTRDIVRLYERTVIPNTQLAVNNARTGYSARRLPLSQLLVALRVQKTQELELSAARIDLEATKLRLRELLSAPPLMRLTPFRPSLFAPPMGTMAPMGASDTVTMGQGMSGPTRTKSKPSAPDGGSSAMGGMP